jgi:hypothetical protein
VIEVMKDLPPNVVGLKATGKVTGKDYEEVVIPTVEARLKEHEKLRLLYHCGPEMTGFDLAAAWDDTKVGLRHMLDFERAAVVASDAWIRDSMKVFGFMMPGHIRVWDENGLEEAKAWVSE